MDKKNTQLVNELYIFLTPFTLHRRILLLWIKSLWKSISHSYYTERILFVLGIYPPESVSLRKGRFCHPASSLPSLGFRTAPCMGARSKKEVDIQTGAEQKPAAPSSRPLPGHRERTSAAPAEDSEALGWQNADGTCPRTLPLPARLPDTVGQSSCQPAPSRLSAAFPTGNWIFLPARTSGNGKGESCAKHYCVKRKKKYLCLLWWL